MSKEDILKNFTWYSVSRTWGVSGVIGGQAGRRTAIRVRGDTKGF